MACFLVPRRVAVPACARNIPAWMGAIALSWCAVGCASSVVHDSNGEPLHANGTSSGGTPATPPESTPSGTGGDSNASPPATVDGGVCAHLDRESLYGGGQGSPCCSDDDCDFYPVWCALPAACVNHVCGPCRGGPTGMAFPIDASSGDAE